MNSYNFLPMTDDELDAPDEVELLPDDSYDFSVVKSTRKISAAGNDMCELQLSVWDTHGKTHTIFDYLVFSTVKLNIKKVSHFSRAVGLHDDYKKGCLPESLIQFCGKLELGMQEPQPKKGGGFYPKKNVVIDYISAGESEAKAPPKAEGDFHDDDIPF